MTTALAIPETPAPSVTPEQMELIRRTIAKDATADELKLYLFDCARQGVHPLDKLIHFTKRSGKYTPITSIDFMRIRAADTGEYAGSDDAHFEEDENHPHSATVTVYRMTQSQRFPYTATAYWSEYKPDANDFMWKKMPHTMLAKCAEALALRKGFPRQLAGLYAKEEMDQAGPTNGGSYTVEPTVAPQVPALEPKHGGVFLVRLDATDTKNPKIKRYLVTDHHGETYSTINTWLASLATAIVQEDPKPEVFIEKRETQYGTELTGLKRVDEVVKPMLDGKSEAF